MDARDSLLYAERYMAELGKTIEWMNQLRLSDRQVRDYIDVLFPSHGDSTPQQKKNILRMKEDMMARYYNAPDLQDVGKNGYRFINAVSDFATHAKPLRATANYKENLFAKTIEGNVMIDRAYELLKRA